ncbi:type II toxin-antitoxin system VapC family toxin [Caenispirillum bisanense]|uniref:PIN domain nuclease, a component of toxin-antitoxin system (PIN domain) n=1 Tax=Caenispirillum bisanense TaxID=414052 RepID=A0A286H1N0_9PROT|nr:type II toxin-antitoxin system VapC family toxin [Caenispirillum bisanense]SOE01700.1 PIN domain nuclease, a component of toxin-antitoxin system (PIN domain) [Caenispirillum bisanense]
MPGLLLLDTHILLWAAGQPERLGRRALDLIKDTRNTPAFSVVSLWEVAIKLGLGRADFRAPDPRVLRRAWLDRGYREIPILSEHAIAVLRLPHLHGDPFDRMLIAQAEVEGATLVTADAAIARYPGPILHL